jgi:hypothetical protein
MVIQVHLKQPTSIDWLPAACRAAVHATASCAEAKKWPSPARFVVHGQGSTRPVEGSVRPLSTRPIASSRSDGRPADCSNTEAAWRQSLIGGATPDSVASAKAAGMPSADNSSGPRTKNIPSRTIGPGSLSVSPQQEPLMSVSAGPRLPYTIQDLARHRVFVQEIQPCGVITGVKSIEQCLRRKVRQVAVTRAARTGQYQFGICCTHGVRLGFGWITAPSLVGPQEASKTTMI